MNITNWLIGGAVVWAYLNRDKLKQALDITSDQNAAYQGANTLVQTITGDKTATVGTKAQDIKASIVNRDTRYLGYPSKYINGKWYVLVDGKYILDDYQTKTKPAPKPATPAPAAVFNPAQSAGVLRFGNYDGYPSRYANGQWYVLVNGQWYIDQTQTRTAQVKTAPASPWLF